MLLVHIAEKFETLFPEYHHLFFYTKEKYCLEVVYPSSGSRGVVLKIREQEYSDTQFQVERNGPESYDMKPFPCFLITGSHF
jgi:hypothetical protein